MAHLPIASPGSALGAVVAAARAAPALILFLDYDGTLVPFAPTPDLASPDPELVDLLRRLAARAGAAVHLVSGRTRAFLEGWFGALPIGLHAEHGLWSRAAGGAWTGTEVSDTRWRGPVLALLQDFSARTPGTLVEEKTVGYAWHYRMADPERGAAQARELSARLSALLGDAPAEVLQGNKVVEVRPQGVDKGRVVREVLSRAPAGALVLAMGDDRTDEDLFASLPGGCVAVHVGPAESLAPLRLADEASARALLGEIAAP
jgi:trehalose 6-phosphate synthase/phosphatase